MPHVTPFKRDGRIDEDGLRACVRFWVEGGLQGLVTLGSNGEAPYLSRDERKNVIEAVIDEANGTVPVIAGTGSMSTWETIQFTRDAKDLGADAALVVTPFYYRLSRQEINEHYTAVLEAVDLPIVLYSVPKFTSYHLDLDVICQLAAEHENVVGVKDSGGNLGRIAETARLVGAEISVLAGTADLTLPTLMLGGKGAVIAVANAFPKLCSNLYEAFRAGNYEAASSIQQSITHINEVLTKRHNQLSAIKTALNLLGLPGGCPRKPALPLDGESRKEIEILIQAMAKLS